MCRLYPAIAHCIAADAVLIDELKYPFRCIARQPEQSIACFAAEHAANSVGISFEPGSDKPVIAPGCTPTDLGRLDYRNTGTLFDKLECSRKAHVAGTNDTDIHFFVASQFGA